MNKVILPVSILLLFAAEILRTYFVMPFPGSQNDNTIDIAYFLHRNIWWIRVFLILVIGRQLILLFKDKKFWRFSITLFFMVLFGVVFYFLNFKLRADKMFYQPEQKLFATADQNRLPASQLIIGISIKGESKAYPIEIVGYHHQVRDTVGGKEVMVTYCTVCRTGRVFDPYFRGQSQTFRLVGMDHFNAMFEDEETKSWWRQATGEAVTGPLKGSALAEITSEQMTIQNWLRKHPDSKIMQPDPKFKKAYDDLEGFDDGTIQSSLEYRNFESWQFKSWVVGVEYGNISRSYDWNDLLSERVVNDSIKGLAYVIVIENDSTTFHVWNRKIDYNLIFEIDSTGNYLIEKRFNSVWNMDGECIEGAYMGISLAPIKASQEFLHSWEFFHPESVRWRK